MIVAVEVLGYAALLDIKTRKVPNKYWIALSIFGLAMIGLEAVLEHAPVESLLVFIPIAAILSDIYIGASAGGVSEKYGAAAKYAVAVGAIVVIGILWGSDDYVQNLLVVPVMMIIIVILYTVDAIRGGADAKALVALAIVFPFYPSIGSLPLIAGSGDIGAIPFPFAFVMLITAAIIVALTPLGFLARNAARGDLQFPQALFGYRMDAHEAEKKHIWLMERMEDGGHILYTRPKREEDLRRELGLLTAAGHSRVWVTPKIPFIVPLLIALVFAAVVGDLFQLLFPL